jgi:hypothetical protein
MSNDGPLTRYHVGSDIRGRGVQFRVYCHAVGPRHTEFDYRCFGLRVGSLLVFSRFYWDWQSFHISVEYGGRIRLSKWWRIGEDRA